MPTPSKSTTPSGGGGGGGGGKSSKISIVTPSRRAYSADPPPPRSSARRPAVIHTPLNNTTSRDLVSSVRRSAAASTRKANNKAPTPHARAAARTLDLRRTAIFTPGRGQATTSTSAGGGAGAGAGAGRRRSGRDQRETPRDVLRALSTALAGRSEAIPSSSSPGGGTSGKSKRMSTAASILEEDEDSIEIDRPPRMSLPLNDDDDEDELMPPRMSDVADYTVESVEMPRRAISEQPRFSRGSPAGSIRMSDFRGLDDADAMEAVVDSGYFPRGNFDETGVETAGDDVTYERIDEERRATLGRGSFGLDMPDQNESTFVMNLQPPSENEADADADAPPAMDDRAPLFDLEAGEAYGDEGEEEAEEDDEVDDGEEIEETQLNGDADVTEMGGDMSRTAAAMTTTKKRKRGVKVSAYGLEYPSLPPAIIKRVAQSYAQTSGIPRTKISPDTLAALTQASDWFFEQLGDSLQAYAKHAGRKTIDESDVITLMRRQRLIGPKSTPFSLAQRHLPRELLQNLRMPVTIPVKKRRKANVEEDADG